MKERSLTYPRLKEILRRQVTPQFGPGYEPSILATREEAPSRSNYGTVWCERLKRDIHTLSAPERSVLFIVLYCPWWFEIQEQRMLPFMPAPHPLAGHPRAAGIELRSFRGTLAVAESLQHFSFHPVVRQKVGDEIVHHPGCWIGDILLLLADQAGLFCVNLNIKQTRAEFKVPRVGITVKTNLNEATVRNTARHEVEKALYDEVGIPTVEVATDELPEILCANLGMLILWAKRKHSLTSEQFEIVLDAMKEGVMQGASAFDVMTAVELSYGIRLYDQKIVLYQSIFDRKLRVDLFDSHFFIDKPMRPEYQDVLEVFGSWFRRPT